MGFRFRRTLKIAPGVHINLSKSGPSLSLGPRGAKYTIGPRGDRATVGIPGTGLSYTATGSRRQHSEDDGAASDDLLTSEEEYRTSTAPAMEPGKVSQFYSFCIGFLALAIGIAILGGFLMVALAFIHWILKP